MPISFHLKQIWENLHGYTKAFLSAAKFDSWQHIVIGWECHIQVCSLFRPNPPQVKKLITNYVKKERKKKYKQCVRQMLTKWGTAKWWPFLTREWGLGSSKSWPLLTEEGRGVYEPHILADKICEQPPINIKYIQSILAYILPVHTSYWEKGY